jgi:hypothetical protein
LHLVLTVFEPTCFIQASKSPEWNKAMLVEYEALLANNTWTLCPIPPHRRIIHNKWVFQLKQNPDGSIECHKARLVAKGFDQHGVDYIETFSPVIKPATVRVLLALAVQFQWPIQQLDISNAFLHGHIQEEVFMDQPQGFIHPDFPHHVCKLNKAIYGLKQAPCTWFTRLLDSLLELGFLPSLVDTSLFVYQRGNEHVHTYIC